MDFVSVDSTQCKCPSTLSCKNHVSLNVFKEEISVFVRKLPLPCTASWQAVYGTAKQWGSFCSRGRTWHDPERAYRSTIVSKLVLHTHPHISFKKNLRAVFTMDFSHHWKNFISSLATSEFLYQQWLGDPKSNT